MTSPTHLSDKELAIAIGKKLDEVDQVQSNVTNVIFVRDGAVYVKDYLQQKASEILFSEGVAGRIHSYTMDKYLEGAVSSSSFIECQDTNGTLDPRKICELYLEMEVGK